jgi:hypothetical protein
VIEGASGNLLRVGWLASFDRFDAFRATTPHGRRSRRKGGLKSKEPLVAIIYEVGGKDEREQERQERAHREASIMWDGDIRGTPADISRAKTLMGWEPAVDWEAAVSRTVSWFSERLAVDSIVAAS